VEALAAAGAAAPLVAVGTLSVGDARDALADLAPTTIPPPPPHQH
jgi:hypothetical protein